MARLAFITFFIIGLLFAWVAPVHSNLISTESTKHAILIGNAAYGGRAELRNPINDVRSLAGALADLGFQIHLLENADKASFDTFLEDTTENLDPGALTLFYYAGHAVQKDGLNWLLPLGFSMRDERDLETEAIGLDAVIGALEEARAEVKIVVLDACRENPFDTGEVVFGDGLAGVAATGETLVAYATSAGEVAFDGAGVNSPYAGALVSALAVEELELYGVFRLVRQKVRQATQGRQLPWVSGSIENEIVLHPASQRLSQDYADVLPLTSAVHWRAIENSRDPVDFEEFASLHPGTKAAEAALKRASDLNTNGQSVPPRPDLEVVQPFGAPVSLTRCDLWVSQPNDPYRLASPVESGLVNTHTAIRDCSIALTRNSSSARLNFLLARALDIAEDFETARVLYERAAELGYATAHFNLGLMYRHGRGVVPDDKLGIQHYFEAAIQGNPSARVALGKLFSEGLGVPKSISEAKRWLELAADDNNPWAIDYLGNLYRLEEKNYQKAFDYYSKGVALEFSTSVMNLARLHRDGMGVEKDRNRAMALFQQAIQLGSYSAPYHLARMLLKPEGMEIGNPVRAYELLELSIERGFPWAIWQLARSWENGDFGERDIETSAFYLNLSIEVGNSMPRNGGPLLVQEATDMLSEVSPDLSQNQRDSIEERLLEWLRQNSVHDFNLEFPY
ncbi:caspase family protein [Tropicimonas sp. S265A]|uniref:caspase family protein n=1 Tax=Tropicimonas sp. S265A TaxID=3415134 RepID=UPI003C7BAC22